MNLSLLLLSEFLLPAWSGKQALQPAKYSDQTLYKKAIEEGENEVSAFQPGNAYFQLDSIPQESLQAM
jgi:hypothetical protein